MPILLGFDLCVPFLKSSQLFTFSHFLQHLAEELLSVFTKDVFFGCVGILFGVLFSILMDRLDVDPANGAAPLLTTLTDLVGISILCGISAAFFGIGPG